MGLFDTVCNRLIKVDFKPSDVPKKLSYISVPPEFLSSLYAFKLPIFKWSDNPILPIGTVFPLIVTVRVTILDSISYLAAIGVPFVIFL